MSAPISVSLSALLNDDAPFALTAVTPLWGLCRADASSATPAPSALLDYCRVQLKATNGVRFEQSATLFAAFSEFFRDQISSSAAASDAEAAMEAFVAHVVPVDVIVDHPENAAAASEESAAAPTPTVSGSSVVYPCWGLRAPLKQQSADASKESSCLLGDSKLTPAAGFAIGSGTDSLAPISADAAEVAHLSNDFFIDFAMLAPTYKSASSTPTGLVVAQHAALMAALGDYRTAARAEVGAGEKSLPSATVVAAAGKAIAMRIPAQAVWRFDFYEGVAAKAVTNTEEAADGKEEEEKKQHSHTSPVLALDSEFLGSVMVYLRKLERERAKHLKQSSSAAAATTVPFSAAATTTAMPFQWRDLDRSQKRRVRAIASLLGLDPICAYVRTQMAADAVDPEATAAKERAAEAFTAGGNSNNREGAKDAAAAAVEEDPEAHHRAQDRKDTMGLIERTMLISALKGEAEADARDAERAAKQQKTEEATAAADAAATSSDSNPQEGGKKKEEELSNKNKGGGGESENEAWVREFKAKVANISRVDALMEERSRQLRAASSASPSAAAAGGAPTATAFVPPHASADDDDLEMPAGGVCYKCGVSGHTAEACKF